MKLRSFPSRAWILIRPALQTAVSLPLVLSGRHIRCMGTIDGGAGAQPVMAKWCQKWPHLCQFEIKDHFVVWTSTVSALSNLYLHFCCGPVVRSLFLQVECLAAHTPVYAETDSSACGTRLRSGGIPRAAFLVSRLILKSVSVSAQIQCVFFLFFFFPFSSTMLACSFP